MKKSRYNQRKRNAKAQEIQARFDEYKTKNEVKVAAINEARAEIKQLREALEVAFAYVPAHKKCWEIVHKALEGKK